MRYVWILIGLTLLGFGKDSYISTQYTSLKYRDNPTNDFLSLYMHVEDVYSFQEGDVDLRLGATALAVLKKSGDFDLFPTIHKNRALIESFSLDYYPNADTMLSIGRQALDINLLHGSFDGLMAVKNFEKFSLKAFYFKHYSLLYPAYYKNVKLDKLYGTNINASKGMYEGELSYFSYFDHKVSNAYIAMHPGKWSVGVEHLGFYSSTLADEKAIKTHLGYHYKDIYAEAGYYHVYEGSLRNIYALGGTEFKTFRLHGFLDQKKAKNMYVDLKYNKENFYAKLHLGYTKFNDINTKERSGKELGITLSKRYDAFELSMTYLTQKSTQVNIVGKRTTWIQTNLKYRF